MVTPPTIELANLGMADSLILMVMALVVFGPRRLPQIGRQIGKLMYEFRKASNDFKFQMEEELRSAEDADRRKKDEERQRALELTAPAQPAVTIEAVSQVSEARPFDELTVGSGAPGVPQTTANNAETKPEETSPRIQPPSTGEQVAASRPWNLEEELEKVSGPTIDLGGSAEPSADQPPAVGHTGGTASDSNDIAIATDEPSPTPISVPEQAAHHG